MGTKKLGRPTDNPKTISLKVALDVGSNERLETCTKAMGVSKAEVVRRGIKMVCDSLEQK